jgi:hypothetical protein
VLMQTGDPPGHAGSSAAPADADYGGLVMNQNGNLDMTKIEINRCLRGKNTRAGMKAARLERIAAQMIAKYGRKPGRKPYKNS